MNDLDKIKELESQARKGNIRTMSAQRQNFETNYVNRQFEVNNNKKNSSIQVVKKEKMEDDMSKEILAELKKINADISEIKTTMLTKEDIGEIKSELKILNTAIIGNLSEIGLKYQVSNIENKLDKVTDDLKIINTAIVGDTSTQGLKDKVEKLNENLSKVPNFDNMNSAIDKHAVIDANNKKDIMKAIVLLLVGGFISLVGVGIKSYFDNAFKQQYKLPASANVSNVVPNSMVQNIKNQSNLAPAPVAIPTKSASINGNARP